MKDHIEKSAWFSERIARECDRVLEGRIGLAFEMVVDDPKVAGGLMVSFVANRAVERPLFAPVRIIADECLEAARARHPALRDFALRAFVSEA